MNSVGFKPTISAGERPQTYASDRAASGTGLTKLIILLNILKFYVRLIDIFTFLHVMGIKSY